MSGLRVEWPTFVLAIIFELKMSDMFQAVRKITTAVPLCAQLFQKQHFKDTIRDKMKLARAQQT